VVVAQILIQMTRGFGNRIIGEDFELRTSFLALRGLAPQLRGAITLEVSEVINDPGRPLSTYEIWSA
jgi:hypothetical protein